MDPHPIPSESAFLPLSLRNILFEIQYCRTMFQSPPLINCMRLVSVKNRLSSFVSRAGHIAIQCSMAVLDVRIRGGHTLNCHPSSTPELHDSTMAGFQLCSCAHALNLFHSGRVPHPPSLSKARSLGSFFISEPPTPPPTTASTVQYLRLPFYVFDLTIQFF